jgi:hypothetical protein
VKYSRKKIVDEFSHLKVSRQVKYQLRKKKAGMCEQCGQKPRVTTAMCLECAIKRREDSRKRRGAKAQPTTLVASKPVSDEPEKPGGPN